MKQFADGLRVTAFPELGRRHFRMQFKINGIPVGAGGDGMTQFLAEHRVKHPIVPALKAIDPQLTGALSLWTPCRYIHGGIAPAKPPGLPASDAVSLTQVHHHAILLHGYGAFITKAVRAAGTGGLSH